MDRLRHFARIWIGYNSIWCILQMFAVIFTSSFDFTKYQAEMSVFTEDLVFFVSVVNTTCFWSEFSVKSLTVG